MKAIIMTQAGTPDVLKLQDIPEPQITTPTQVKVSIKAAGVNPIDIKLRSKGTFYPEEMPAVLGCDGAGIVTEIGANVTQFQVGDEVYYYDGGLGKKGTGNYAEWAVVEEHLLAPKPKSLSFAEASAVPLVLITAWEALYDRAKLTQGQTALIHAGAGGVGHIAIQLAKLRGATVLTTVSTPDKERLVRQLGADYPILYKDVNWVETVLNLTQNQGVDVAFDTVGGKLIEDTFPAVKVYGDLVTILQPDMDVNWKVARGKNLRFSMELMLTPALMNLTSAQAYHGQILRQGAELIDRGELNIHLSQTYPFAQAAFAHQQIETGSTTGKLALVW